MIKQYPHYLFFITQDQESVQDEHGDWSGGTPSLRFVSMCRAEPNGSGRAINGADGMAIVYSFTIYLPKGADRLHPSTEVRVCTGMDAQENVATGRVLNYSQGQLNCRLWL